MYRRLSQPGQGQIARAFCSWLWRVDPVLGSPPAMVWGHIPGATSSPASALVWPPSSADQILLWSRLFSSLFHCNSQELCSSNFLMQNLAISCPIHLLGYILYCTEPTELRAEHSTVFVLGVGEVGGGGKGGGGLNILNSILHWHVLTYFSTVCRHNRDWNLLFSIKGTVSRDGFGFWCHVWLVLGLNRGQGHFLNFFSCSVLKWFYNAKSVFFAINASLLWLNNDVGVYLVQVSLLLIGQQGLGISAGIGPCFLLAEGLCKFYANAGGNNRFRAYYNNETEGVGNCLPN